MSNVVDITADNFQSEVIESPVPVLLDIYGSYCPPCRQMAPIVKQLAAELEGKAKVAKASVDDNLDLVKQFGVGAVPTFLVFCNGKVSARSQGSQPKSALLAMLETC
jgi:thioredoxin 1